MAPHSLVSVNECGVSAHSLLRWIKSLPEKGTTETSVSNIDFIKILCVGMRECIF